MHYTGSQDPSGTMFAKQAHADLCMDFLTAFKGILTTKLSRKPQVLCMRPDVTFRCQDPP